MYNNPVITIARQYGSGGREIGEKLAMELGVPFYDKAIIDKAAKETGFCAEFIEKEEQKNEISHRGKALRAMAAWLQAQK